MGIMVDKETREAAPITGFLNADQLAKDVAKITDGGRSKKMASLGMALAVLRNYNPFKTTTHFTIFDLLMKFDKGFGLSKKAQSGAYGKVTSDRSLEDVEKRRKDRWNILFVAGMWFQDLFNYDFRRTEQCIIPYATQEGEISFCAYNTGVGWRNIIEKMHMTATLTKWYDEHGRHEIFAGGKKVSISDGVQLKALKLNRDLVTEEEQHDLEHLGIAKNAREEKIRARDARQKSDPAYNEKMAKLYREVVLKEKQPEGFIPLTTLAPANGNDGARSPSNAKSAHHEETETVLGD
jgi:hypothetical protein